jgi:tRNA(Arg) A34 adenosine deaminase TadA
MRSGRGGAVPTSVTLALPSPVAAVLAAPAPTATVEDRMALVLALARGNVDAGGGPFAAAVFDASSGELLAGGVNLVVPASVPVAHAEIVAFALAGVGLGTFDLAAGGPLELVSSCEPCAMCLGAIPWGGVTRLVCGARDADARAIGFDEGDKPDGWADVLRRRDVEVLEDVRRDEAVAVLQSYLRTGRPIYNGTGRG